MGDGIADEIIGAQNSNGQDYVNYPSGFGDSIFSGEEIGGGVMSEAEQLEAAIAASLAELNVNEGSSSSGQAQQ